MFAKHLSFKTDKFEEIMDMLTYGCFIASADLKDVYYVISIAENHRK